MSLQEKILVYLILGTIAAYAIVFVTSNIYKVIRKKGKARISALLSGMIALTVFTLTVLTFFIMIRFQF